MNKQKTEMLIHYYYQGTVGKQLLEATKDKTHLSYTFNLLISITTAYYFIPFPPLHSFVTYL